MRVLAGPAPTSPTSSSPAARRSPPMRSKSLPRRLQPAEPNLYEWSASGLSLVNLLPGETEAAPGAAILALPAARSPLTGNGSTGRTARTPTSTCAKEAKPHRSTNRSGEGGTSRPPRRRLDRLLHQGAATSTAISPSRTATDLTPAGGVAGVLGASADGSSVYYQDASGIFLWHEGTTHRGGARSRRGAASDYPPRTGTARVSADGAHLAFLSAAELTDYDNVGRHRGLPLRPAAARAQRRRLICASCNPTGERPRARPRSPAPIANGSALHRPTSPAPSPPTAKALFFRHRRLPSSPRTPTTARTSMSGRRGGRAAASARRAAST